MMGKKEVIINIEHTVKAMLLNEGSGHDWWHVDRVRNTAIEIAIQEQADVFLCEVTALLHDIADHKFGYSDIDREDTIRKVMNEQKISKEYIDQVIYIVNNMSYKGGANKHVFELLEAQIVQDADRLDALGAIGISRAFAYGGHARRTLYNPELINFDDTKDTISHFYNKLFNLKDLMHTNYGKKLAEQRELYMKRFLEQFYAEWNGNL